MRIAFIQNIRDWIKKNNSSRLMRRAGQVLIEFALAIVGLIILAFLTARVAPWLNDSMVERNINYQDSRVAAGSMRRNTLVGFDAPQPIHLIGPLSGSTPGVPPQPPGPPPTSCGIGTTLTTLADKRDTDADLLESDIRLNLLPKLRQLEIDIDQLIKLANAIMADAIEMEKLDGWIQDIDSGSCSSVPPSQIGSCQMTIPGPPPCPCSGPPIPGPCTSCGGSGGGCCSLICAQGQCTTPGDVCNAGICGPPLIGPPDCSSCGAEGSACCDLRCPGGACSSPAFCVGGICAASSACLLCSTGGACCPDKSIENCFSCPGDCGCIPGISFCGPEGTCVSITCSMPDVGDCGSGLICVGGFCEVPPLPPPTCVGDLCTTGGLCCTPRWNCWNCPGDCGQIYGQCAGWGQTCNSTQLCQAGMVCCSMSSVCKDDFSDCP